MKMELGSCANKKCERKWSIPIGSMYDGIFTYIFVVDVYGKLVTVNHPVENPWMISGIQLGEFV